MKRAIALALSTLAPAAAFAADLPAPVAQAPAFVMAERWTGFYVGAGVGVNFGGSHPGIVYGQGSPGFDSNIFKGPGYLSALSAYETALEACGGEYDRGPRCRISPPSGYLANPALAWPGTSGNRRSDFVGTLAVGYNWQRGAFVLGFEWDVSFLNNRSRTFWTGTGSDSFSVQAPVMHEPSLAPDVETSSAPPPPPMRTTDGAYDLRATVGASGRTDWLSTLRGRVGYAAGPFLLYATGGVAFGGLKMGFAGSAIETVSITTSNGGFDVRPPPPVTTTSVTTTQWFGERNTTAVGGALGAGAEWALNENWSIKGEYLYYNLGSKRLVATGTSSTVVDTRSPVVTRAEAVVLRERFDGNIVRVGVNYRFGGTPAPVVASY